VTVTHWCIYQINISKQGCSWSYSCWRYDRRLYIQLKNAISNNISDSKLWILLDHLWCINIQKLFVTEERVLIFIRSRTNITKMLPINIFSVKKNYFIGKSWQRICLSIEEKNMFFLEYSQEYEADLFQFWSMFIFESIGNIRWLHQR
jgi:hypothetical protein